MSVSASSAAGGRVGLGIPDLLAALPSPHLPHRVPSVSPLTTPALQAACLGVQMKRRKVACALLALRWNEESVEYWTDVNDVLDTLKEGTQREGERLGEVIIRLHEESGARDMELVSAPPWRNLTGSGNGVAHPPSHFAPTASGQGRMENHIQIVQQSLERAWEETALLRGRLDAGDDGLRRSWDSLRAELGVMIREVERGRETLCGLEPIERPASSSGPTDGGGTIPDFLRTWEGDDDDGIDHLTARSTSGTTAPTDMDITSPNPQIDDEGQPEILVPPGADDIYEADLTEVSGRRDTGLGKMGREERLGMMRLAREQGLTLGEYMRRMNGVEGDVREVKEMDEGGKRVVDELKSVIGAIRVKKLDMADEKRERGLSALDGGQVEERTAGPFSRFSSHAPPQSPALAFGVVGNAALAPLEAWEGRVDETRRALQEDLTRAFSFPGRMGFGDLEE
jgi:hypothetical protein